MKWIYDDDENLKYMATMSILITILIQSYNVPCNNIKTVICLLSKLLIGHVTWKMCCCLKISSVIRNQPSYNSTFENGGTKFLIVYPSQSDESVVTGDTYPSGGHRLNAI